MKKLLLSILCMCVAASAWALLNGDGYYRVRNAKTARYVYVCDDRGSLNFQTTTAELGAIELWKGYERTVSDPASVIYITDLTGKNQDFDLQTQGTGVKAIINYPVSIFLADKKNEAYSIFGRNSGLSRYIGDGTSSTADRGYVTSLENGEYYRWNILPIDHSDNYFGLTPELSDGTGRYTSLYAGFPVEAYSQGVTLYTVAGVADGKAYLKEVNGVVPAGTAVIAKVMGATAADNKLTIGGSGQEQPDNMLRGVYFSNTSLKHKNLTPYDKTTMRVLGTMADGSVGFVTAAIDNLPRNKAYLTVPAGTAAELHLTTEALPAGIADTELTGAKVCVNGRQLTVSGAATVEVFNITGNRVALRQGTTEHSIALPSAGLYLVKAAGTVTKVIAK